MKEKIKLYIISGFLGSGKTTFLKRMLTRFSDEKIGVIINEFGDIGVDGKTINRNGVEYVEVSGGSIFCSCLKADFVKTLVQLQKEDIDVLLIENSGLADPSTMNALLGELSGVMERGYAYQGSVCIVDLVSFLKFVDMLPPLKNQILSSDFVILNKADLADSQTVDKVRQKVRQINPKAFAVEAVHADVRLDLIDSHLTNSGFEGETCNTPWNRPETYTLRTDGIIGKDALARFVGGLSGSALRVKGFVQTEAGWIHIDAVGENCELKALRGMDEELKANQGIVIIGKDSTPFRDKVSGLWREAAGQDPVYIDE